MGTQAPEILSTNDYHMFQMMTGNRPVMQTHVKQLMKEMSANPHLFSTNPILVNENLFVIDGQHRLSAARALGIDVYYTINPGINLDDTRALNSTQRGWQLMDFAGSYADSGREDYQKFVKTVEEFPAIRPHMIRTYLLDGRTNNITEDFRQGKFMIADYDKAIENLTKLDEVVRTSGIVMNTSMAMALLRMFHSEIFDYDLFIGKLRRDGTRELFQPHPSVRGCLRSIENVYNFQSKTQKRLF